MNPYFFNTSVILFGSLLFFGIGSSYAFDAMFNPLEL